MRTTLAIDDELLAKARSFTGIQGTTRVVKAAIEALIERESIRRLIHLGGSEPSLTFIPRRQSDCTYAKLSAQARIRR